jgi:hypothetical protein
VDPSSILATHGFGFCCNNDFDMMTEKTRLLMSDQDLCRTMGKSGRAYATDNHDLERNAKDFELMLRNLAKR